MKVYSSETNIDVYGSDQSYESESPFEGALQIMSITLKNDLNIYLLLNRSFKRFVQNTDSSSHEHF